MPTGAFPLDCPQKWRQSPKEILWNLWNCSCLCQRSWKEDEKISKRNQLKPKDVITELLGIARWETFWVDFHESRLSEKSVWAILICFITSDDGHEFMMMLWSSQWFTWINPLYHSVIVDSSYLVFSFRNSKSSLQRRFFEERPPISSGTFDKCHHY